MSITVMEDTAIARPKKPRVEIDKRILKDAKALSDVEKQVIVHCYFKSPISDSVIRIWKSTYLRDKDSSHKSKMLTAFNISVYPTWTAIKNGKNAKFTLVFSALPKDCNAFDLFEDIPHSGGFFTGLISRNKTDVYTVEICT